MKRGSSSYNIISKNFSLTKVFVFKLKKQEEQLQKTPCISLIPNVSFTYRHPYFCSILQVNNFWGIPQTNGPSQLCGIVASEMNALEAWLLQPYKVHIISQMSILNCCNRPKQTQSVHIIHTKCTFHENPPTHCIAGTAHRI